MAVIESVTVVYKAIAAVADRSSDADDEPDIRPVTANVDLTYRVPPGWSFKATDYEPNPDGAPGVTEPTDIGIESFEARLDEGQLLTLGGRSVLIVANTPLLEWPYGDLFVDVRFRNVVYNRKTQRWASFAFIVPTTGGTTVNLTTVERHPYVDPTRYADWFSRQTPVMPEDQ
ncbi:hypothetical protein SEA_TYPHA_128 [Mycobacterium phage Typha]|uniref:Uncharacterized protein n=1 Tax=Mycobacterium phage Typha TaxID=2517971 RepID=A0A482J892_9CAUD|nr:tail protein [Mycobacterium phage Typha]QBP29783.1 hypothetical protein SEA_TYPHA_128 [Mycobacterium phage Typha]URM86570.1 hypothetical protein PBI_HILLTOPFARM_133 [Mycobacterium phage Hilltopfarm]